MNNVNLADLPKDVVEACRAKFEALPSVKRGRAKATEYYRKGDFIRSLKMNQEIDALFEEDLKKRAQELSDQKVVLKDAGIPDSDIEEIIVRLLTAYMAMDILDYCIVDMKDLVKKTSKNLDFALFDDLQRITPALRAQLRFLSKNTTYLDTPGVWDTITDNMYEMMRNKAKAINRKSYEANKGNIVKDKNKR